MRVVFANKRLEALLTGRDPKGKLPPEVVRKFCQRIAFIQSAKSERDFYAMKSLHFEKLQGDRAGQHSMRLNMKWRLVLEICHDEDGQLVCVIEVVDYHKG